jgi:two-component system, chemotaxis family, chemotaxis protein CheY
MDSQTKILVVEDEKHVLLMIKEFLKKIGFVNIIDAGDGATGLQRLRVDPVDLILSDWDMPDMTGIEFLKAVRDHNNHSKTPFLMITAHRDKDSLVKAIKEGVSDYIVKPFTIETLEAKIYKVLNIKSD